MVRKSKILIARASPELVSKLDQFIEDGWYLSYAEFLRDAVRSKMLEVFELFYELESSEYFQNPREEVNEAD